MPPRWKLKTKKLGRIKSASVIGHVTPRVWEANIPGSYIHYEASGQTIWLLMVHTHQRYRRQGRATFLLKWLTALARRTGRKVNIMGYSACGQKYIRPIMRQLAKASSVELCD